MEDRSLPRAERLSAFGAVRRLFAEGRSGFVYPFRYLWLPVPSEESNGVRVLFSVPKKYHKRANRRNTLRRRTKEAYRLNKALLEGTQPIDVALVYTVRDRLDYSVISHAVRRILEQIAAAR